MKSVLYANLDDNLIDLINNHNDESMQFTSIDIQSDAKQNLSHGLGLIIGIKNGHESLLPSIRQLKETNPSIPFIVISTQFMDKISFWCLRNRVWDYIVLPAEIDYFVKKLKTLSVLHLNKEYSRELEFPTSASDINSLISYTNNHSFVKTHRAIEYIQTNYNRKIEIKELAELCKMTLWQFTEVFKAETGLTPREYMKVFRLTKAKYLLLETDTPVQQIAYAVGYEDSSYFCRLFKSESGKTPKTYRSARESRKETASNLEVEHVSAYGEA